jgi:hypothetical protein
MSYHLEFLDFKFACIGPGFATVTDDWSNACHATLESDDDFKAQLSPEWYLQIQFYFMGNAM